MTTLDDIHALLPDNTSGDIGADDVRDSFDLTFDELALRAPKASPTFTGSVSGITAVMVGAQPVDADLTTIAGLTATTDSVIQAKGSAWAARTIAQLLVDLAVPGTTFQPLDSDLTAIAGVTPANDDVIQRKAGAWVNRTMAQLSTDLGIAAGYQPIDSDLTTIAALTATTDSVIQAKGSAWSARTIAQLLVDLAVPGTTFQPLDSDLTAIAAITPSNDDIVQRKAGVWVNRTIAQLSADLGLAAIYQPLDSDLSTIAGLTATTDSMIQSVGSAWASRTPAQVKTALAITTTDVTNAVAGPASAVDNAITRFDSTTGKLIQNSGVSLSDGDVVSGVNGVTFDGVASPSYVAGSLVYDTDNESLTFFNAESDISMQVGQELWLRVNNVSGSTIANGVPVYISGSSVGLPTIAPANANSSTTVVCAGLTTHSIENNTSGYVTMAGVVHGLDTSGFTAGAIVYVGTSAGTLTSTAPVSPNYRYRVGIVAASHATLGAIHVTPSTAALGNGASNSLLGIGASTSAEYKAVTVANGLTVSFATPGQMALGVSSIDGGHGGTGVANTNKTITVSGNTIIGSSTDTVTFVTAGATSVTLPTSGTLATTAATQPVDSDLTTIAGLTATTDSFMQAKGSAWSARTVAQVLTDLAVPGTTFQPLDSDLSTIAGLTATTDSFIQSKSSAWASRTLAQVSTDLATPLQTAGLAPKASPTFTGTVTQVALTQTGRTLRTYTALTDAATILVDASLNDHFAVTLGGNRTLGNPSNPPGAGQDQMLFFAIRQDGTGTRTLALDTNYRFGTDITSITLSTAINKTDYLGVRYNVTDTKWDVIAFVKGY